MPSLQGYGASPAIDPEDEQKQRVVDQFHSFPFSSDEAFQHGLSGILAHESTAHVTDNERSELVLKTKIFYFKRVTGHDISLTDVLAGPTAESDNLPAESGNEHNQAFWGAEHEEIRTLTFAELKSLIEQGKTDNIPNNKIIPNILNDGVPSESTARLRKKPWEVASES